MKFEYMNTTPLMSQCLKHLKDFELSRDDFEVVHLIIEDLNYTHAPLVAVLENHHSVHALDVLDVIRLLNLLSGLFSVHASKRVLETLKEWLRLTYSNKKLSYTDANKKAML